MKPWMVLAALMAPGLAQAAEPALNEAAVRAFVARQEAAWNARDVAAFFATFTPDAVFVDQARDSHGGITANGRSTLLQAKVQAGRFVAKNRFSETSTVDRVVIAPDGRSARVFGHERSRIESPGRAPRTLCAETDQTLVLRNGRLLSRGQTDTDVRCPR
jgi:uncharacterized protein (TIGR02246 family)